VQKCSAASRKEDSEVRDGKGARFWYAVLIVRHESRNMLCYVYIRDNVNFRKL
jgi:hypothetical protein